MSIARTRLDSLLGEVYSASDFGGLTIQSAPYLYSFPTVTATTTGVSGPGTTPNETLTVTAFSDTNATVTLAITANAYAATQTYYVIGVSNNGLFLSTLAEQYLAADAMYNPNFANSSVGVLSAAPITSGLSLSFSKTGIDAARSASADFNGDNKSDLLLQNNDGAIVIYTQADLTITSAVAVGNPGPTWHVVATADMNGDGSTDILLQNNNGAVVDYLMSGSAITSVNALGSPGSAWHVRGAGDFNTDGNADIVLQNDNGNMVVWSTNGTAVTAATSIGIAPAGWTIEAVADFNGDGHPDVLLQNTNGSLVDYLMNGTTITAVNALGNPGTGWAVAGTGDYNGDGKADIVLHNDNGATVVWETDGTSITNSVLIDNPGSSSWYGTVSGVDLNGDGSSDLVVSNTSGSVVGLTANSSATITGVAQLASLGTGWNVIGNTPMQFIDGTAVTGGLTATPGADQFDFTSSLPGSHAITGFDPALDSVALSSTVFANYAAMQAHEAPYMGGTLIALSSSANVVIQGVTPSQLGSSNFVFR